MEPEKFDYKQFAREFIEIKKKYIEVVGIFGLSRGLPDLVFKEKGGKTIEAAEFLSKETLKELTDWNKRVKEITEFTGMVYTFVTKWKDVLFEDRIISTSEKEIMATKEIRMSVIKTLIPTTIGFCTNLTLYSNEIKETLNELRKKRYK